MANHSINQNPVEAYVYAIVVDGVERYIGKGRTTRSRQHLWNARSTIRRRARGETIRVSKVCQFLIRELNSGAVVESTILADGMTDEEAYAREIEEITKRPVGQLWNIMPGGRGFTSEAARDVWTEEYRAAMSRQSRKYWDNPGRRQRQSQWAKAINDRLWSEGSEYRQVQSARTKARTTTPEGREVQSRNAKKMWSGEFRARRSAETSAQNNERWSDPSEKTKLSIRMRKQWSDPARRERQRDAMKAKWADPEWRKSHLQKKSTDDYRKRMALAIKLRWADPNYRAKVLTTRASTFSNSPK